MTIAHGNVLIGVLYVVYRNLFDGLASVIVKGLGCLPIAGLVPAGRSRVKEFIKTRKDYSRAEDLKSLQIVGSGGAGVVNATALVKSFGRGWR